ncbi:MAG TPA: dTDP-4-dehydrorhamnose reductase [Puia sp.]|jgi:dTDP-4-dehydrorhamnose reductase
MPTQSPQKKKILVTGAGGQLGRELRAATDPSLYHAAPSSAFPAAATVFSPIYNCDFTFADRNDLPIEDPARIHSFFSANRPDVCINCAAYTAVDKAETEKELAFRINGEAVGTLAAACHTTGTRLLHISTDYVFDGNSATALKEGDPTGPVNIYGASKLRGEQLAMEQHAKGTAIFRTSWVYSEFGNNFVRTMIRLMREKPSISVIDDQIGSPTYAADLAAVLLDIAAGEVFVPGIYHYSNEGRISWYEFALAIKTLTGSPCPVQPIPTTQYPTPAKRPHYSLMDKSLIRDTYGITIPDWKESLATCITRLIPPAS